MRLRDMLSLLEEARYIGPDFEVVQGGNPPTYQLKNRSGILKRLQLIGRVPPLQKAAEQATDLITPLHFLPDRRQQIIGGLGVVKNESAQLAAAIAAILPSEDPLSLSVRIPEPESLEDFEQIVRAVRLVFERTATNFYRGTIDPPILRGFDVGSQWLVIGGIATGIINFTFAILQAGASYRQKVAEAEQAEILVRKVEAEAREAEARARKTEAEAREAEANADFVEIYRKRQKAQLEGHLELVQGQLTDAFDEQRTDGDQANATNTLIRNAIVTWADLLKRGAVVHPALNAPPDIAALCPTPDLDSDQLEERRVHLLTAAKAEAEPAPEEEVEAEGDET